MLKFIYLSNPFGMTFILIANLSSSSIVGCESGLLRLQNTIGIELFNLTLILQSLCAGPLNF